MTEPSFSATAQGASFLIGLQVSSRAITFVINQFVLRYLSPDVLGAASQLELFSISVLYFARDNIRVALQRQRDGLQSAVNMAYIAMLTGVPLAFFLAQSLLRREMPPVPNFESALWTYCAAIVVELLSEPGFVVVTQMSLYRIRAAAEGVAALARCLVTYYSVVHAHGQGENPGVLPLAHGQLAWTAALLIMYAVQLWPVARQNKFSLLLHSVPTKEEKTSYLSLFPKILCQLAVSLTFQSGLKYVLTQGDAIVIATLASLADQGAYALASNYGGLIARMVFQPIEESSRRLFAQLAIRSEREPTSKATSASNEKKKADTDKATVITVPPSNLKKSRDILLTIVRLYTLFSLPCLTLLPTIFPLLLRFVAGERWTDTSAPAVLSAYSYYIPLLALNGILEAFVAAVATEKQVAQQSVAMIGCFVAFVATSYFTIGSQTPLPGFEGLATDLGSIGVVVANGVNLAGRITWAGWFIYNWFAERKIEFNIQDTLPSNPSMIAATLVPFALRHSARLLGKQAVFIDLIRVGIISAAFGAVWIFMERNLLWKCYYMIKAPASEKGKSEKKTQ